MQLNIFRVIGRLASGSYAALLLLPAALCFASSAASVPAAIYTDPRHDREHPASMAVLHVPSGAAALNGVAYLPAGAGPHPVLLICHGLPGNEKNLDLAQAARRAGWVAVTFNYRGSWGSPGTFSFTGNIEDARAMLEYLREPAHAAQLRLDPHRIVLAGHSMGGDVAVQVGAGDPLLAGTILISAADLARAASMPREKLVALMDDNRESLSGVTAESMAEDVIANAAALSFDGRAEALSHRPLLVLTSDDGFAPESDALVAAARAAGGTRVSARHVGTDHVWSDRRVELESIVLDWLRQFR